MKTILSPETIKKAFGNADFGNVSKEDVIKYSLLKYACGYSTGHTAREILLELKLIRPFNYNLTKDGREYLYEAFSNCHSF